MNSRQFESPVIPGCWNTFIWVKLIEKVAYFSRPIILQSTQFVCLFCKLIFSFLKCCLWKCQIFSSMSLWLFSTCFFSSTIASFIHSFVQSVNQTFIHSFIHPFIHSLTHSFIHSLTHLFIHYSFISLFLIQSYAVYDLEKTILLTIRPTIYSSCHLFVLPFVSPSIRRSIRRSTNV